MYILYVYNLFMVLRIEIKTLHIVRPVLYHLAKLSVSQMRFIS